VRRCQWGLAAVQVRSHTLRVLLGMSFQTKPTSPLLPIPAVLASGARRALTGQAKRGFHPGPPVSRCRPFTRKGTSGWWWTSCISAGRNSRRATPACAGRCSSSC
jgi:hypothetical protein